MNRAMIVAVLFFSAGVGVTSADDDTAGSAIPDLFLSIVPEPGPVPPGELGRWQAHINALAMREGPAVVRVNLPGQPASLVSMTYWSPREGYIPYGSQWIPDPDAPPEAFSWRWSGWGAAITMVRGVAAGRVDGRRPYSDWRVDPRGIGLVRLRWIGPQPGSPSTVRAVPSLTSVGWLILALLVGGIAVVRIRSLAGAGHRD